MISRKLLKVQTAKHKKLHFAHGRNARYEKGIPTLQYKIVSIEPKAIERVYDVEMLSPYHNFVTDTGIVTSNSHMIIFMHIREPEEIERARKKFDALTLLIKRPGVEPIQSNHADRDVDQYDYDYLVVNNGTLDDLGKQADDFVEKVISGYFEMRRDSGK